MSTEQNKLNNVVGGFSPNTNINPLQVNAKNEEETNLHFREDSFILRNKFALLSDPEIAARQKVSDNIYFNGWDQLV